MSEAVQPMRIVINDKHSASQGYSANIYAGAGALRFAHVPAATWRSREDTEAQAQRIANLPVLEAERLELVGALEMAEAFIAGFEHDETQSGVENTLRRVRYWIGHVRGTI